MAVLNEFIKTKKTSRDIMVFLTEHREELYNLLKHITWEDILMGRIVITDKIVNDEIKPIILDKLKLNFTALDISFKNETVCLDITDQYKGFPVKVSYMVTIKNFEFHPGSHVIALNYIEEISSIMNIENRLILSSIRKFLHKIIGKSFIEAGLDKLEGISFNGNEIVINFDDILKFKELINEESSNKFLNSIIINFDKYQEGGIIFTVDFDFPK
ncbi:hypothetical protein OXPF_07670 [Oxobacter pfennigii]|uniref:Uncharacterized protein n=1 Tax=Oxobacter pfennigii TaxID=36849 RepID=A0A0P8WCB6_9CLOT|nr:hypothetical protein [Oxobacter pfennigii]KPU45534.1 hypothetical protein OXPF_07670 [Oxobacter pfennigii]